MLLTKHFYYFILAIILFSTKALAKNDTIYFDKNWKIGQSKWYSEDGILTQSTNYINKLNNNDSSFRIPKWPIIYLGYSITTKSQFTGGLEFCLDCKDKNKLFLGVGYGITNYDGKYYGLPDLHLSYNLKEFLFIKTGASDKNAYALAGLTFLNMIDLGFGYSESFNKEKTPVIEGFTFGITFRFTKNNGAYGKLKMM